MSSTPELPDDSMSNVPQLTTSLNFYASDGDVIFKSSDDVLFHIHRKNLETHAAGFPPSEFDTKGEIVPLTEDASTLENLFRYIYPQRTPDIELLTFDDFYNLAEASEKYEVFNVMNICKMRIKHFVPNHPVKIINFAFRHGYHEIISMTVPFLLDTPLDEVVKTLLPELIIPWMTLQQVSYRESWNRAARKVITTFKCTYSTRCTGLESILHSDYCKLWVGLGEKRSLKAISEVYSSKQETPILICPKCKDGRNTSRISLTELEKVPAFITFL